MTHTHTHMYVLGFFHTKVPAEVHVPQLETRGEAIELLKEVYRCNYCMLDGQ